MAPHWLVVQNLLMMQDGFPLRLRSWEEQNLLHKGISVLDKIPIYKMRWNPQAAATNQVATHQYATDIGWAAKQVKQIS